MSRAKVALDILLHRSGQRLRCTRWPGGWLMTLEVGRKRAVLDRFTAAQLRDVLTDFVEDPPSEQAMESAIEWEREHGDV